MRATPALSRYSVRIRIVSLGVLLAILPAGIRYLGPAGAVGAVVLTTFIERLAIWWKGARLLGVKRADLRLFSGMLGIWMATAAAAAVAYGIRYAVPGSPTALHHGVRTGVRFGVCRGTSCFWSAAR